MDAVRRATWLADASTSTSQPTQRLLPCAVLPCHPLGAPALPRLQSLHHAMREHLEVYFHSEQASDEQVGGRGCARDGWAGKCRRPRRYCSRSRGCLQACLRKTKA